MQHSIITGLLLAGLSLAGCHGNIATLHLPNMEMEPAMQESSLAVAVAAFQDQRDETEHLGVHISRGGGKESIGLKDGSLSHTVTQNFLHFLNQSGVSASADTDAKSSKIRIEADIKEFRADVTDRMLYSLLEVEATMTFMIHNIADGNTMRVTIAAGKTSKKMFFNHHDMEALINATLREGFTELLKATEARGVVLTFARHILFGPQIVFRSGASAHLPHASLTAPSV